jgi:hypothetical protein
MRKIIVSEFYTLDGLMSDQKDKMEWVLGSFNDEMGKYESDLYDGADTLLLGEQRTRFLRAIGQLQLQIRQPHRAISKWRIRSTI